MTSDQNLDSENGQGVPRARDGQWPRSTIGDTERGLPDQERAWLRRLAQNLRVGTLSVGTMTGKGTESVDLMERKKLGVMCIQETRWKGNKARELGAGFKLFYSSADANRRSGVGIILEKELI